MNSYFFERWAQLDKKRMTYIQDGLQLWLDGIQNSRNGHDSAAKKWEDLSSNHFDFTPKTSGKYPTVGDSYFTGFSSDIFFVNQSTALQAMGPIEKAGTLETVAITQTAHTGQIFGFKNVTRWDDTSL